MARKKIRFGIMLQGPGGHMNAWRHPKSPVDASVNFDFFRKTALKADADVILRRVKRRSDRPLLQTDDPTTTVQRLIGERYPAYALADLTVLSREVPHERIVEECITALAAYLGVAASEPQPR